MKDFVCPLVDHLKSLQTECDLAKNRVEQGQQEIDRLTQVIKMQGQSIVDLQSKMKQLMAEFASLSLAFESSKAVLARALGERDALLEKAGM